MFFLFSFAVCWSLLVKPDSVAEAGISFISFALLFIQIAFVGINKRKFLLCVVGHMFFSCLLVFVSLSLIHFTKSPVMPYTLYSRIDGAMVFCFRLFCSFFLCLVFHSIGISSYHTTDTCHMRACNSRFANVLNNI